MANQTDLGGPSVTSDYSSDEHKTFVVRGIRGGNVGTVWRPAKQVLAQLAGSDEESLPQSPEERAPWGIFERLRHLCFQRPVSRSPDLHRPVVRLSGKKLSDWVPTHTLYESVVLIKLVKTLYK